MVLLWPAQPVLALEFMQSGPKLVGSGVGPGQAQQGFSVALSADRRTAIVGGPGDDLHTGAAWVFTLGTTWTQQGNKLVGSTVGTSGPSDQGYSVALSADGNTALIGGPTNNGNVGAAWVFTRTNGVWTQQGGKLVGSDVNGNAQFGWSVALSADGNTALIGGPSDNIGFGAAWVFIRSGDPAGWFQQGAKLVGTTNTSSDNNPLQGNSVALSADGDFALVGAPAFDNQVGAVWAFSRNNGVWTQIGCCESVVSNDLTSGEQAGFSVALGAARFPNGSVRAAVGTPGRDSGFNDGAAWLGSCSLTGSPTCGWLDNPIVRGAVSGHSRIGWSVALSPGGGVLAITGGPGDNNQTGAAFVHKRTPSGGSFTQKLVGNDLFGPAALGHSVAMSCDTAIVGGPFDHNNLGAAWVFVNADAMPQSLPHHHDFNGDCMSDIMWRNSDGAVASWLLIGRTVASSSVVASAPANWTIVGQRDFNGDGTYDLLWRDDSSGTVAIWLLNDLSIQQTGTLGAPPLSWSIVGTGDFDGDGKGDILWRNSNGDVAIWSMNGLSIQQAGGLGNVPASWSILRVADFNGDGKADILWRDTSGNTAIWLLNGLSISQTGGLGNIPTTWSVVGTADFNADGKGDLLWLDNTGNVAIWLMNGLQVSQSGSLGNVGTTWLVAGTADFNGDGNADILWRDSTGVVAIWLMNGLQVSQSGSLGAVPSDWTIVGTGDFNGDGKGDILWKDSGGNIAIWLMNGLQVLQASTLYIGGSWNVAQTGDYNADGMGDILWRDGSGNTAIWFMNGLQIFSTAGLGNIPTTWTVQGMNAD